MGFTTAAGSLGNCFPHVHVPGVVSPERMSHSGRHWAMATVFLLDDLSFCDIKCPLCSLLEIGTWLPRGVGVDLSLGTGAPGALTSNPARSVLFALAFLRV